MRAGQFPTGRPCAGVARLAVVAAVACIAAGGAHGDMLEREFFSTALERAMPYSVYLPPGYDGAGEMRYPVLYLLHGVGDNHRAWVKRGKVRESSDRLIESGELAPFMVVMPAAQTSWYVDSREVNGPGDYAAAVRDDLVRHVDAAYATRAQRSGRAVAGLSMGGFGALRLALERPEVYAAAAGMSSALWLHVKSDTVLSARQERIFKGSFGTPFDPVRFLRQSPAAYLDGASRFRGRLGIYITAGDDDRFGAYRSSSALYSAMRDAGVAAQLRITDGGHAWSTWASSLPDVLRFVASYWSGPLAAQIE